VSRKHVPSMNAAQQALGDQDNPPRRGTFPVRLLVNSQFDDQTRGPTPSLGTQLTRGIEAAQNQTVMVEKYPPGKREEGCIPRFDLRNNRR
jgi:hypothetical protein